MTRSLIIPKESRIATKISKNRSSHHLENLPGLPGKCSKSSTLPRLKTSVVVGKSVRGQRTSLPQYNEVSSSSSKVQQHYYHMSCVKSVECPSVMHYHHFIDTWRQLPPFKLDIPRTADRLMLLLLLLW